MFYLFHGSDDHSKKQTLDKLKAKLGDADMLSLNTTRLDGKSVTLAELQNACNAMPFLSPKRLVLVDNLLNNKPPKALVDGVVAYLPDLPPTTNLVFLESKAVRKTNAVLKFASADKGSYVKLFELPQGNQLARWVRDKVAELGGQIGPRATQLLVVNVGSDLQAMENEITKLVLYKDGEMIGPDDVEKLGSFSAESSIFDLVDALGNRNGKTAVTLLQRQLNDGADPFYLFSMFIRQFRLLIQVRECLDTRVPPQEIPKMVGIHSFVAGKLTKQARSFSLKQLEQIYAHLLDIDVGVKTGKMNMPTALNLLVANLAN